MMKTDVDRLIEALLQYLNFSFDVRISFNGDRSTDDIYSVSIHVYDYKYYWTTVEGNALILELVHEKDGDEYYRTITIEGDVINIGDKKIRLPNVTVQVGHSYDDGLTIRIRNRDKK